MSAGLIAWLLSISFVHAEWTQVKGTCSGDKSPCRVLQGNNSFDVKFEVSQAEGLKRLEKVMIRNLKNGETQSFEVEGVSDIKPNQNFRIYRVNLRPGEQKDLALHAFNSAREGETFYYFLYDSKTGQYKMTDDTYPKLIPKADALVSELQGTKYKLGPDLTISQAE